MIEVDGSFGEGGGQILRTTVSLAAVLGKDVRISNIRAGRPERGLKAQHLTGVRAVAEICGADVHGSKVGSTELVFKPGPPRAGHFRFDVGTAGSVTLVLQSLMPVLAFAQGKVELEITGGTDVRWSPPLDYLQLVALPIFRNVGFSGVLELVKRGHYPRGGGLVRFESEPCNSLRSINGLSPGSLVKIGGVSHAVNLPRHVAERQAESAGKVVQSRGLPEPEISIDVPGGSSVGVGSGLVLYATMGSGTVLGADSLGERGKPAEQVGSEAGNRLVEEIDSEMFLDRHMGDMIIPYMALAQGVSEVSASRITQHVVTNARVAEWVSGVKFAVEGELGRPGRIRAEGLGFTV